MKCFLDLDGVLVDFMAGAHKKHNIPYSYEEYPYPLGEWDCLPPDTAKLSTRDFWDGLTADVWENFEWMPDGKEILSLVEKHFGKENICILTSPSYNGQSALGKIKWIQREMPEYKRRFLIGTPKHFCADMNAVLIDDSDMKLRKFEEAGGQVASVPRKWNSEHVYAHDTVRILELNILNARGL